MASAEYKRQWYLRNRERILTQRAEMRAQSGYADYQHEVWERRKVDPTRLMHKRKQAREYTREYKDKIYDILGHCCNQCGFSDERALQIDHIDGGGREHRLRVGRGNRSYYKSILDDPKIKSKFQILCANCNWIKRAENKECAQSVD